MTERITPPIFANDVIQDGKRFAPYWQRWLPTIVTTLNSLSAFSSGTYANRPAATDVDDGSTYYATDQGVTYLAISGVWIYMSGVMRGTINPNLKPTLALADAGFVFYSTDFQHTYRWTGAAWEYAPGDDGSGFITHFAVAPRTGSWQLCDGTAGVYESKADGTRAQVAFSALAVGTMPNLTGTVSYLRNAPAVTGTVNAAVAPGISGQTDVDPGFGTEVAAGGGSVVASHTHQHLFGSLAAGNGGQPRNMDAMPYYRL